MYDFDTFTIVGRLLTIALKKLLLTSRVYIKPNNRNVTIIKTLFKYY
jgi:hypothetical protein